MGNQDKVVIRQSNDLIEASYKIETIGESRIIRLLIAQIKPEDEDFKAYKIKITDFSKMFGLSDKDGRLYELIEKASKALTSRQIEIKNGKNWLYMNWLSSAKYEQGSGYVELRFDVNLKPYLLQLKGYFTQYQLNQITHFRGIYSIRLYEFLKMEQFKANKEGKFKVSLEYEELRKRLKVPEREYSFFKDFRVKIIEQSIREINESSDILVSQTDYAKTGRKVSHIVFYCEEQEVKNDEPKKDIKKEPPLEVRELVSFGIDETTAYKWRKKYGVKNLTRNIAYTKAMKNAGKIRDSVAGFLCKAITDNLGGVWEAEQDELKRKRKVIEDREEAERVAKLQEAAASRARLKALLEKFEALPADEQSALREAFEKQLNSIVLPFWRKAKERNPERPELHATVKASFLSYVQDCLG